MTQPCKNFKECRGYAKDRFAKLCPKCWTKKIDNLMITNPLEDVAHDEKNIYLKFKGNKNVT